MASFCWIDWISSATVVRFSAMPALAIVAGSALPVTGSPCAFW